METEYEWLTVDEAVEELEAGGEVFDIGFTKTLLFKQRDIESVRRLQFSKHKIRKPLTPEQLIAAGTPLLAEKKRDKPVCKHFYDRVILVDATQMFEGFLEFVCEGIEFPAKHYAFVTNKNGNYITIKDGVAEEVLR
jgi:hypothetical protein